MLAADPASSAERPRATPPRPAVLRPLLATALGVLAVLAYRATGARYYGALGIPQGTGMDAMVTEEVAQIALYVVFGGVAVAAFAVAIGATPLAEGLASVLARLARRPRLAVGWATAFVLAAAVLLGRTVTRGAVTTDDEHVYRFIARTLRTGSLVAPSPGRDLDYYREQFVVLTPRARYGKYPIGHPLALALGDAVGLGWLVVPLLTAATVPLSYAIARRVMPPASASVGTLLLATSPQLLLTGATWLSQATSAAALAAGVLALLEARAGRGRAWIVVAGLAFGYGLLARPMPGLAFAAVGIAWAAFGAPRRTTGGRSTDVVLLSIPVALAVAVILAVNHAQSGAALVSGYQAFHGNPAGVRGLLIEVLGVDLASASASAFAGLFRLNVWLLGWPLSLLPCVLARRNSGTALLWSLVGVEVAYRIVLPKAGVSTTGPVYFHEVVPVLCLLAGDGIARLASGESGLAPLFRRGPRASVAAGVVAAAIVNVTLFLPARVGDLARAAAGQEVVRELLEDKGAHHALVFHRGVVPPWTRLSWAYFPPCNSPGLDDDVLFVRRLGDGAALAEDVAFWKRAHADRTAWVFDWPPGGAAALVPLEAYAAARAGAPPPKAP